MIYIYDSKIITYNIEIETYLIISRTYKHTNNASSMENLYLSKKIFSTFMNQDFSIFLVGLQLNLDDICRREITFNCC
jgi:hypothetical protein